MSTKLMVPYIVEESALQKIYGRHGQKYSVALSKWCYSVSIGRLLGTVTSRGPER